MSQHSQTQRCRVLVVEDDADQRALLLELLREDGHQGRGAATGREGLTLLAEWRPHIVLLDLVLPDMHVRAFRAEQQRIDAARDVPLILLSATHARALRDYVVELGAAAAFEKPFDVEALLTAISEHCRAALVEG